MAKQTCLSNNKQPRILPRRSYFFSGGSYYVPHKKKSILKPFPGYDIFLLVTLFVVCFFISRLPRNYREGKCFFGTSIGLLITWAIWLTCFILVEPECRDMVVCFGIIATAYLIIIGVLIPRTYYMIKHLARGKEFGQRFGSGDLVADPRISTIGRQVRIMWKFYVNTILT